MKAKTVVKFELHGETEIPQDMIDSVPRSGPADTAVSDLRQVYEIEVSHEDVKLFLRSYGALDDEELANFDDCIDRLIWLACLDCRENDTTYFYMGE